MLGTELIGGLVIVSAGTIEAIIAGSTATQVIAFVERVTGVRIKYLIEWVTGIHLPGEKGLIKVLEESNSELLAPKQPTSVLQFIIASVISIAACMLLYGLTSGLRVLMIGVKSLAGVPVTTSPTSFGLYAGFAVLFGWAAYFHALRSLDVGGVNNHWSGGM